MSSTIKFVAFVFTKNTQNCSKQIIGQRMIFEYCPNEY